MEPAGDSDNGQLPKAEIAGAWAAREAAKATGAAKWGS